MGSLTRAYTMGVSAHDQGQQLGMNPYSPDSSPGEYEAWLDGWSAKDDWIEDRMSDREEE